MSDSFAAGLLRRPIPASGELLPAVGLGTWQVFDVAAQRAKEELRERVAELAVAGAERILRREINAKVHAELLSTLKQELR